jgi:hypothetical protein
MTTSNLERIAQREVAVRRRSRIYLAALGVAVGVVMASLMSAI